MANSRTLVLRKPLTLHSTKPMTGFMRDGYCRVPPSDYGNHSVAGTTCLLLYKSLYTCPGKRTLS